MWYMYGDKYKGVRISLPELPFKRYTYTKEQQLLYGLREPVLGGLEKGIPLEDILQRSYSIVPTQIDSILYKIEYTDSEEMIYPRLWKENGDIVHFTYGKMGKNKNTYWSFQKEWRYMMTVWPVPLVLMNSIMQDSEQLKNMLMQISNGKIRCPLPYYDLGIDSQMLDKMKIVLGPLIDEEKECEIKDIIKETSDRIVIEKSDLKGRIRE